MCKKKRPSAPRRKQPPPNSTVDQSPQPPSPAVEPMEPEVRQKISKAIALIRSKEYDKALDFIKESINCHPKSGQLRQVEGIIYQHMVDYVAKDDCERVKHLTDGVFSAKSAVELLPNSINCVSMLADLLIQLGYFDQEWDRVVEVCKHGLTIENPTESGVEKLFREDVSTKFMVEDEKQALSMCWDVAETQKKVKLDAKRAVEVVNKDVDINYRVVAMDRRKKQFREMISDWSVLKWKVSNDGKKKFDGEDKKREEYKRFWSGTLSDEKKRGFRKVKIEELEKHYRWLRFDLAVNLLSEAITFAKEYKTWKFWECCDCVKKFGDCETYRIHLWKEHWKHLESQLTSDIGIGKESIDMIVDGVWNPVDTHEVIKIVDSGFGSEKDLVVCKSSSSGEFLEKISESDNNESSKTSLYDPKRAFCDDSERAGILMRIHDMFELLLKNKCLVLSHVCWVIEYTKDHLESIIPLSYFRDHGQESLQMLCFLGSSQLRKVLNFLGDVVCNCGLSANAELDNSRDYKLSSDHFNKKVVLSKDIAFLLLDNSVMQGELDVTNCFDAVADDGSAVSLAVSECEDDVFPDSDVVVSWLLKDSNCGEALESWTSLRDWQRGKGVKFLRMFDEELFYLPTLFIALQTVDKIILEEDKKRKEIPEHEPKFYLDLLKEQLMELKETDDNSIGVELYLIHNNLEGALQRKSIEQSKSDECCLEGELGKPQCLKLEEKFIKMELKRLKRQLLTDLSYLDAIAFRCQRELVNISVYDYRSIILPLLQSFLQIHLYDLFYKDAEEKCEAAAAALLAEEELEAKTKKKNNNKGSHNTKHKQNKKKKKKNKNLRKTKEATDASSSKHFELSQKDEERNDNTNSSNDDSLDESEPLAVSDEEQKLNEHLEKQRRFENQANLNVNASGSRLEELLGDYATEAGEGFQPDQNDHDKPHTELGDSARVDESENLSAIEEGMSEEQLEYQGQLRETIGGNVVECVSNISSESNHEEYEKRFLSDIERAICLSLDCFEKCHVPLLPKDVSNGKTSRLDVQLYVIVQCQWYLRQIRDEFMCKLDERHTHAGDPCFHCAYRDTFSAIRIASRDMPEEAVQLSSGKLYPVYDFFKEWSSKEHQANKVIGISPSAYQLKQLLIDVVRKTVVDIEHERQINNKDKEKDFADQNMA